jgi:hypothetical protein
MGLTPQEQTVSDAITEVWNAFSLLPVEHPDDTDEFRHLIHAARREVLMRPARRELNVCP